MTDRAALLGSLLVDPSRATEVPREEAVALLAALAALQGALLRAACRPAETQYRKLEGPEQDRMLTIEEAAELIGVSRRWLYRHAKTLPFSRKLSRKVLRFSRAGIARWLATRRT